MKHVFRLVSRRGPSWLECAKLARVPWLVHAFSTRLGGVSPAPAAGLNLGYVESDRRSNVDQNRTLFLRAVRAEGLSLATVHQVHSAMLHQVTSRADGTLEYHPSGFAPPERSEATRLEGDALLTRDPGVLLSVRSADCMPVLLADRRLRAVGAVHAGWRGALNRILEKSVGEMRREFGSRPQDVLAALGPSIRACCYEVGEEVRDAFAGRFPRGESFFTQAAGEDWSSDRLTAVPSFFSMRPPGQDELPTRRFQLDLVAAARDQLQRAGLPLANILVADFCTACRTDLFFSHRKEGSRTGRMMAVIGIRLPRGKARR